MTEPNFRVNCLTKKLITDTKRNISNDTSYKNSDIDAFLLLLKKNNVPLLYFDQKIFNNYCDFFKTAEFKKQYESEAVECHMLRTEWAKIKNEFVRAGIESIFIKSVGYFPYKSSNLDVLIKQSKREMAESVLKTLGYYQLHNVEEPYKTLFRKFKGLESTSVIHLHNKVAWINPFHEEELLWARCRQSEKDDLIYIPSPEDSILILTAHWFYVDIEINLSDLLNISICLNNRVNWKYIFSVAERFGWVDGLYFGLLVQSFLEKNIWGKV